MVWEAKVAFWSCSWENTQAKVLFIRVFSWRNNQPVPVSHLHLKCSIQLIENMAILNYFLATHWHSQGSCCCSPINIILLYRFLFWHSVLLYWYIYSLLYKWIILFIIYSFELCCGCTSVRGGRNSFFAEFLTCQPNLLVIFTTQGSKPLVFYIQYLSFIRDRSGQWAVKSSWFED